ncbi:polymorphic toxin-type HINT domain-containing protein [Corallococcus sp. Z5C101001]|uniref:polymorphic toxin-type HINT domain-containing protein n=1 Tax=Corallococcus sp. Z5C101001 TaxID=2596829 RepID=UPI00117EF791|nr:polymorphic toxin-type HINT domain-containing protein [Corallococcus sp. Z5C101001]TSC23068.1 hypothetical protein FOF48_30640 [Corallococcus sp. Z5C101001]
MRSVLGLVAGLWCGQVLAQPFNDALVQAPQLDAPRRGSLVGQYAATELGPADVSRGGFSLASTFAVPTERGVLHAQVFPSYSPEGGIGEWGQGWGVSLAMTRTRVIGELDYSNDELTGPWGRMVKGTDGRWYPVGLKSNVRMEEQGTTLVALLPDGSRWTFGGTARVQTARGTYAWHLTQVVDVTGHKTKLEWTANASGRLFLTRASYGGLGDDFQERVDFIHEPVTTAFVDWRSGEALRLDRRVTRVEARSKDAVTGLFGLRWSYAVGYHQDALGPAFQLESVQRTYASGQSAPAVTYAYERASDLLPSVSPRFIPKFDGVMLAYSEGVALPSESTPLDDGDDGLVDLENRTDFSLIRQQPGGYTFDPLPPAALDARIECRPDASAFNQPRLLARMRPEQTDYQVVSLSWNAFLSKTEMLVCERDGHPVHQGWLHDAWELGPNTRLVDLNRDRRPDLLAVYLGGYSVLPNESTATAYAFAAVPVTGTLNLQVQPQATWVHDFNGDSVPDLVVRSYNDLFVYAGKGQFLFEPEPHIYEARFPDDSPVSLAGFELSFTDINNDGLQDVIAGSPYGALLLVNDGTRLVQVPVPALELLAWNSSFPVVQDLEGTGNTELFFVENGLANSVALDTPGTGLLKSADDGKGTRLAFTYARSPVAAQQGARQPVLDTLTVQSSGQETRTYQYTYGQPAMHSVGRFLLGYGQVTRESMHVLEEMHFLNEDASAGLLLSSRVRDDKAPRVEEFSTLRYEAASLAGVPWKRLQAQEQGWRSTTDNQLVSELTEYEAYTADVCSSRVVTTTAQGTLTTERTRASVSGLGQALHCLESRTVLTGQHAQAWMDFRHEALVERDSLGQVTAVRSVEGTQTLTLQQVTYNPDASLASISVPGKGVATFHQEPGRRLLYQTNAPDGVVTRVVDRDPLTDAVLTLEVDRGGTPYRRFFRYDGQERLSREWDSLGGSQLNPKQTYGYHDATATAPASFQLSTLVDASQGAVRESVEYVTASGDAFTTAHRIPEGWSFDSLSRRDGARAELRTLLRPPVGPAVNMLAMDYAALLAGGRQVAFSSASAFGHDAATTTAFHEGVEKQVATSLGIESGVLMQTAVENGTFTASRTLDAAKRVLAQEDEAHTRHGYHYDASGRLREVVLPDGATHRVHYDGHGRVGQLVRQGIATVEYTYDATKDRLVLKRFVSPAGVVQRQVAFAYDTLGRLSTETHGAVAGSGSQVYRYYHDGASPSGPATLDQKGLLTAVSGDGYLKTFTYREDGRLTSRTLELTGWRTVQAQLAYNDAGDVTGTTTVVKAANGTQLSSDTQVYKVDTHGRLKEAWLGTGNAAPSPWASLDYDSEGRVSSVDFSGGTHVGFGYDAFTRRRTTQAQSTPTWSATTAQRLNARGLVESEDFTLGAQTWQRDYTYSPQGFLTQAQDAHDSYLYGYAPEGLPLSIQENGTTRPVTRVGNTLTAGNVTYTFDALGRAVTKGNLQLTYGPNGHVASATRGTTQWNFLYDEAGQRILKREGSTPVAAYLEAGEYLDASGLTLPVHFAGQLVGVIQQGVFRPLAADARGTLLTDTVGAPFVASPYGNRAAHPDVSPALEFVQKGYDADLGLIRMGVRDYDATLGQFLSPDGLFLESPEQCLANPSECNLYSYARGNPTGFTDPSGKCSASLATGIDCMGPALAQGAAIEAEMVDAWRGGNYGTAAVAGILNVGNGAYVVTAFMAQGVVDVGNGTYTATSGFMEGDYDKALNGSVQTLMSFTFARLGQVASALSAELAPVTRITAQMAATKAGTTMTTAMLEGGGCFVAGTVVLTAEGMRPIEEVTVGDQVWAWDEESQAPGWHPVTRTFIKLRRAVVKLELVAADGTVETLGTTVEHPFWVQGRGWTQAQNLVVGDALITAQGAPVRIRALSLAAESATVYNLEVEQAHTYFVGTLATWVHNTSRYLGILPKSPPTPKSVNLPSLKKITIDIGHILSGHLRGGSRVSENKGLFQNMTEKQIEKAVREAYRYAKTIERQGPRVRAQGPGPSPAYVIEMWINLETKVMETAYPVFR